MCYSAPLISWGDSKRKMVRMMSGSPMRVKWCGGPGARALILGLLMGQLCLAMTLPVFARPSPSSAFSGLLHAKNFRATFENRPLSMAPLTGDPADSYALVPSLEVRPQWAPLRPALLKLRDPRHAGPLDLVVGGPYDEAGPTLSIFDKWWLKTGPAPSTYIVTDTCHGAYMLSARPRSLYGKLTLLI